MVEKSKTNLTDEVGKLIPSLRNYKARQDLLQQGGDLRQIKESDEVDSTYTPRHNDWGECNWNADNYNIRGKNKMILSNTATGNPNRGKQHENHQKKDGKECVRIIRHTHIVVDKSLRK